MKNSGKKRYHHMQVEYGAISITGFFEYLIDHNHLRKNY